MTPTFRLGQMANDDPKAKEKKKVEWLEVLLDDVDKRLDHIAMLLADLASRTSMRDGSIRTQRCKTRLTTWLSSASFFLSSPLEKWIRRTSIRCIIGYCSRTPRAIL
jgi:hypothetical protein